MQLSHISLSYCPKSNLSKGVSPVDKSSSALEFLFHCCMLVWGVTLVCLTREKKPLLSFVTSVILHYWCSNWSVLMILNTHLNSHVRKKLSYCYVSWPWFFCSFFICWFTFIIDDDLRAGLRFRSWILAICNGYLTNFKYSWYGVPFFIFVCKTFWCTGWN